MNAIISTDKAQQLEQVLIGGDLAKLSADQRTSYYYKVCESVGLNPLTKPFEYITLNGKLTLYAKRDCTDQLRKIHGVSVKISDRAMVEGVYAVTAQATDKTGRADESIGAVSIEGLKGEARANGLMKAETKAKRRVTLSICGLGMLDETEVETIQSAVKVDAGTGEVIDAKRIEPPKKRDTAKPDATAKARQWVEESKELIAGLHSADAVDEWQRENEKMLEALGKYPELYAEMSQFLRDAINTKPNLEIA